MWKNKNFYDNLSYLQILEIDYFILKLLKKSFENKNIDFVCLQKNIKKDDLKKMKCEMEVLEKRVFFNIWAGFVDLCEVPNVRKIKEKCKEKNIDFKKICVKKNKKYEIMKEKYYSYFLDVKINSKWIKKIPLLKEEIKAEIKKNSLLWKFLNIFRHYIENYESYKKAITIIITILVVFWTSLFGIKSLEWGTKLPIWGSILDVKKIDFEEIGKDDEYYTKLEYFLEDNEININSVESIKIKNISATEKIVRLTFKDWQKRYFLVEKLPDWYTKFKEINSA